MKSIIVHDWMLKDPRLSGIKLLIYAVAYGFINLGHACFLSNDSWIDLLHCSRSQFFKAKKELIHDLIFVVDKKGAIISVNTLYKPIVIESESFLLRDSIAETYRIAKTPWVYDE